ncbi:MAG: DUF4294 domain-containing protein [Bacteroidetes bacterium]|nr:MAG: DUF4294 domain-containing protein [Bacteroidota bacterium]
MIKSAYKIRLLLAIPMLFLMASPGVFAQQPDQKDNLLVRAFPYHGETLPTVTIKDFRVVSNRTFKSEKDKQAYLRLKRNVRKAYPYAILASVKLREYDAVLNNMPEAKRAPYLKKAEKELKTQFEGDLKNLTMTQGKILIRLINRETGMTTYKVIKDYRGGFSAFMWQSFGLLFGNNLKWKYDPSKGEDKMIEEIIQQIQDGEV